MRRRWVVLLAATFVGSVQVAAVNSLSSGTGLRITVYAAVGGAVLGLVALVPLGRWLGGAGVGIAYLLAVGVTTAVPLGVVMAKATPSAPWRALIASRRSAVSLSASSQEMRTQPGSAAPFGRVRLIGHSSRSSLCTSSGAARPLGQILWPVGWLGSASMAISLPSSTWAVTPQRERHCAQ